MMKALIYQVALATAALILTNNAHAGAALKCRAQALATERAIQKIQQGRPVPVKLLAGKQIRDELATVQVFDIQSFDPKTGAELRAFSRLSFVKEGASCTLFKYEIPDAN